ncbi:MAG: hypothetical protein ABI885_30660 [Gammaproteobacteria bacterium]
MTAKYAAPAVLEQPAPPRVVAPARRGRETVQFAGFNGLWRVPKSREHGISEVVFRMAQGSRSLAVPV